MTILQYLDLCKVSKKLIRIRKGLYYRFSFDGNEVFLEILIPGSKGVLKISRWIKFKRNGKKLEVSCSKWLKSSVKFTKSHRSRFHR